MTIPPWVLTVLSGVSLVSVVFIVSTLVGCGVHVTRGDPARALPAAVLGGACALALGGLAVAVMLR